MTRARSTPPHRPSDAEDGSDDTRELGEHGDERFVPGTRNLKVRHWHANLPNPFVAECLDAGL